MNDMTKTYFALLGAVVLTLGGMHVLILQPAERRAEQRFERMEARLDRVDERFDRVDERFDKVDERFRDLDKRFDGLERTMDERFREVDKRFDDLEKSVDERVDKLETDLAVTTQRLDWEQQRKQERERPSKAGFT